MKKILFCVIATMLCLSMLVGCGNNTPPDNNNPGTPSQPNVPTITEPELKPVGDYFAQNAKVKYYTTYKNITDQAGNTKSFESLVDRQIDILANDILYRLVAVYGAGTVGLTTETGKYGEPAFGLIDPLTENVFTDRTNNAVISNYELISLPNAATENAVKYFYKDGVTEITNSSKNLDVNEPVSYARSIYSGQWGGNLRLTYLMNNTHSINGGYYWDNEELFGEGGFNKALGFYDELSWNWNYNDLDINYNTSATDTYTHYHTRYIDDLKTAIGNILLSGNSSGSDYQTAVSKINKLGFNEQDKTNIKNFILQEVIGAELISADDARKPEDTTLSNDTTLSEDEHYYKAYSLLIPEILNRAFENTFSGTDTSLYLNAQKVVLSNETDMSLTSLSGKNFESIKLIAKGSTPLTKLIFSVSGEGAENLEISYSIYKDGNSIIEGANNIAVTVAANGKFELNFSAFKEFKINEGGYIKIAFINSSDNDFNISFDGYYNK